MKGMKDAKPKDRRKTASTVPEDEVDENPSDDEEDQLDEEEVEPPRHNKAHVSSAAPRSKQAKMAEETVTREELARPRQVPYVEVPVMKVPVRQEREFIKTSFIPAEKHEPAYRNIAPVQENDSAVDEIMKMIGDVKIEITQDQLMKLSKEARQMWVKHLSPRRVPTKPEERKVTIAEEVEEIPASQMGYEYVGVEELPPATIRVLAQSCEGMPKGAIIIEDPVVQYLNSLRPGEEPRKIVVAGESHALKARYPVINGSAMEESLLDGGSQIVSMAKDVAIKLGISWDPEIVIHMQSANKQVEKTLGLGKNVPFRFNEITVYLQVHVMASPAYKVLLGRPFEVLTESETKNLKDGSQLITITDPNSGHRSTMPSYDRGQAPALLQRAENNEAFRASRI